MSKIEILRAFVNQRLSSAVDEIFVLFERTITEYEDEVSRLKEENKRQRKLLDAVLSPEVRLHRADVQQLLMEQEWSSSVDQKDPESSHFKVEQEELWSHQDGVQLKHLEKADVIKFSSTPDPVKNESDEEEAQSSQLHQSQTEENREAEPPASSSAELMKTEADKEDCDGPTSDLTKHMRIHTGEKPFICSFCDQRFHQKRSLTIHMRLHAGEKPFSCLVCGKRFTHKSSLVIHMRLHSAEKPFSCLVCGKTFTQKTHLTIHMQHHSGEKPFSCLVCGKRFTQKTHLTIHMRHHSGEKPFSCSVCGKRFTQKSSLSRHLRIHSVKFDKGFTSP